MIVRRLDIFRFVHQFAFHGVPFQAILCRNEPSRDDREVVVFSVGWLQVCVDVAGLPSGCFLFSLENKPNETRNDLFFLTKFAKHG